MKNASGKRMRTSVWLLLATVLAAASGCGESASGQGSVESPQVLSSGEAKALLLQLPHQYRWRQAELPERATSALAGTVIGNHRTIVHFGISFGKKAGAVSVPQAGVLTPDYYGGRGFVFNDDLILPRGVGRQFHTAPQWHEAIRMVFEMEEKLCKAAAGKPCPV